jgi:hypothetical protein
MPVTSRRKSDDRKPPFRRKTLAGTVRRALVRELRISLSWIRKRKRVGVAMMI